ncbi:MAG: DUF983 domain-containing protein [Pirellulales bacterium]
MNASRRSSKLNPPDQRTVLVYVLRALRLRCPDCGGTKLFSGPFRMRETCDQCGLKFYREPGFYLGSIYVNYGLTALLVMAVYFGLVALTELSDPWRLGISMAVCVLFPLWFFRYARAIWLAFDRYFDRRHS